METCYDGLEAWQLRVVIEHKELSQKVERIEAFIKSESYNALNDNDKSLLLKQANIMHQYSCVLKERINRFDNKSL